jgi:hypothetical protein
MNDATLYLVRPKYRNLSDFFRLKVEVDGQEVNQKLGIANVISVPITKSQDFISVRTENPEASLMLSTSSQTDELAVLILTRWKTPFFRRAARIEWINPRLIDTYAPSFTGGREILGLPSLLVRMILTGLSVIVVGAAVVIYGAMKIWDMPTNVVLVVVSLVFASIGGSFVTLGLVAIRGVRDFFSRPERFK